MSTQSITGDWQRERMLGIYPPLNVTAGLKEGIPAQSGQLAQPQQIAQQPEKPKKKSGRDSKRLIRLACVQILDNPSAPATHKLRAASMLARMNRERDLALRERRREKSKSRKPYNTKNHILSDILCHGEQEAK